MLFAALLSLGSAGPAGAVDGAGSDFIWPTTGRVTQRYGCTGYYLEPRRGSCAHFHGGIDIANSRGTPVRAAADGIITHVGWDRGVARRYSSWLVIINHGGGIQTLYFHLKAGELEGVQRGTTVEQGDLIGLMGTTGMATGPHLHFSIRLDGSYVDPRDYVDGLPTRRRPRESNSVHNATCSNFGAGMGAWNGGVTAVETEFDGPRICAA